MRSFKTHDLDVLLTLSGIEEKIKTQFFPEWSSVIIWDPETRYNPIGTVSEEDAKVMIKSAEKLLEIV